MQDLLVSILIPFKNTAEFLPACLDSILKQSYTYWEVLAVDDHSTDDSLQILEQ
ncbi:MAG: glycosyltransferase family A protein, partial [Bacteroidota bacterium]